MIIQLENHISIINLIIQYGDGCELSQFVSQGDGIRDISATASTNDVNQLEEGATDVPDNPQVISTRKRLHPP